jgi:hypothetical protein
MKREMVKNVTDHVLLSEKRGKSMRTLWRPCLTPFRSPVGICIIIAGICLCVSLSSAQTIFHVNPDGNGDFPTIQAAINAAVDGDTIQLTDGTYSGEGNRDIDFAGKAVVVQGNLSDPNQVVINCQGTMAEPHRGFKFMTAETEDSILDGVTISQGYAPYDIAAQPNMGGAVYCAGSSPTLRNCIFRNNTACLGGGVYTKNSYAIIWGCQFLSNSTESSCSGGGMYNESSSPHIEDCLFSGNYGYHYAGGLFNSNSSPTVIGCRFVENAAETFGGGMVNYESSSPQVVNCLFSGNSIGQSVYGSDNAGGGMYNLSSSPTLTGCIFVNNSTNSHQNGGAMGNCYYSLPTIARCTFSGNTGGINGGAIYNNRYASPVITECAFASNTALAGGGIYNLDHSSPVLTDCTFSGNSASGKLVSPTPQGGGAIYSGQHSNPRIQNCQLIDNDAYYGGGLFNWNASPEIVHSSLISNYAYSGGGIYNKASSAPVLDTCYLESNEAKSKGGAVFNDSSSPVCVNTVFWKNIAVYYGNSSGGAFYNTNASPSVLHCTLVSNGSMVGCGFYNTASSPVITNCILFDGSNELANYSGSIPVITYSALDSTYAGTGNIYYQSPLFVDRLGGDFRLTRNSPCVDTANNAAVPADLTADKLGTPRIIDGDGDGTAVADMGAYEYYLPGDVTMNAAVNDEDLMQFFPQWLRIDCLVPENCMQADIDRNGKVNLTDFGLLASHWLEQ